MTVSQIKQIGGRAGRFRSANQQQADSSAVDEEAEGGITFYKGTIKQSNVGLVTCLDERDLPDIRTALLSEADPIKQAGISPPVEVLEGLHKSLPAGVPHEYLLQTVRAKALIHPRFFLCDQTQEENLSGWIENIRGLSVAQRSILTAAPVPQRDEAGKTLFTALSRCVASRTPVTIVDIPEIPLDVLERPTSGDRQYLVDLESLHKSLILYLWLSYRFRNVFLDQEMARHAKTMVEDKINGTLLSFSATPALQKRLKIMREAKVADSASAEGTDSAPETEEILTDMDSVSNDETVNSNLPGSTNDLAALAVDWESRSFNRTVAMQDGGDTGGPSPTAQP